MEKQEEHKQPILFKLFISFLIILGLISSSLCITAEFKKAKKDELKFENGLCYLPKSGAFSLGLASLILLVIAQISGNLLVCNKFISGGITSCSFKIKKPPLAIILFIFSWMSLGVAIILISTATSMSQSQQLGEGWVNAECYLVKDGIFIGSAILILITIISILSSAIIVMRQRQIEKGKKVHAHTIT